jgi:hypothetical protein
MGSPEAYDPCFPDPADERLRPAGAVSRMAPGETRSRPIRERQSVCPIRRMRAEVRKGTQERKTGLPAGHWETVLDGEVLREVLRAMLGDDFGMAGPVVLCYDGEEKADRNRAKHP